LSLKREEEQEESEERWKVREENRVALVESESHESCSQS
jgi:hypothetical protein